MYEYPPLNMRTSKKQTCCVFYAPFKNKIKNYFNHHKITDFTFTNEPLNDKAKNKTLIVAKKERKNREYIITHFNENDMYAFLDTLPYWEDPKTHNYSAKMTKKNKEYLDIMRGGDN